MNILHKKNLLTLIIHFIRLSHDHKYSKCRKLKTKSKCPKIIFIIIPTKVTFKIKYRNQTNRNVLKMKLKKAKCYSNGAKPNSSGRKSLIEFKMSVASGASEWSILGSGTMTTCIPAEWAALTPLTESSNTNTWNERCSIT